MKLMVTGATGQLGALSVESLLQLVPAISREWQSRMGRLPRLCRGRSSRAGW
ncbi:hypothetical protein SAMN04487969_11888 [Paenibacillus algorifonticola]|uniref:Uncharacterized protein n=1 Tax=Paenibacillus algorifonticola TaxID=684063 RepID=A0A1I2GYA4_9BACL|nr:hypothetical protein SAMN04487969_11888 [Paenibacillus algorifonticola]